MIAGNGDWRRHGLWSLGLVWLFLTVNSAEPNTSGGILFLHLHWKDGAVSLVKSEIRPGILKQPRDGGSAGNVTFELLGADGAVISRGSMADPSVRRVEYADPDHSGAIEAKVIVLTETEFTVRLRQEPAGRRVRFLLQTKAGAGLAKQSLAPRLLGIVELPVNEPNAP